MFPRVQPLRARLAGAVGLTLSRLYRGSLPRPRREAGLLIEPLEDRTLFGFTPGYNQTVIPTAPCGGSGTVQPAATTSAPITAFDGMPKIQSTDLQSTNFGITWGVDRSWVGLDDTGPVGNGWAIAEAPYLVVNEPTKLYAGKAIPGSALPDDSVSLVQGGAVFNFTIPEVASNSSQYAQLTSTDGYPYTLTQATVGGTAILRYSDDQGNTAEFYDVPRDSNNRPQPFTFGATNLYGKFYKYTAASGTTVTASYNSQDQITGEVIANPASPAAVQYVFNYSTVSNTLGGSASLVSSIVYQEAPHGTDWETIRSAGYIYYNGTGLDSASPARSVNTSDGRLGDLESVTITDGSGNVINSDYYRYYELTGEQDPSSSNPASSTNNETTTGGPSPLQPDYSSRNPYPDNYVFSGLKTVVQGASVDRLAAAVPNYLITDDSGIQPYINNFFNYERWDDHGGMDGWNYYGAPGYDSDNSEQWNLSYMLGTRYRAVEEIAQSQGCSSCSQGQGTFKYEYAQNYGSAGMGYNTLDYNNWRMKTTELLPDDTSGAWADNNLEVIYSNEVGQPMLDVQMQVAAQAASVTGMSVGSQVSNGYSITVTANNSFSAGQSVNILGVLPEMYNGVFKITSATSTSFTFTLPQTYIGASGAAAPTPYVNTTTPTPGAVTLGAGSATLVTTQQATGFRYDDSGRLIQTFNPSAIIGYDDSTADLFDSGSTYLGLISANSGLITTNQYAGWSFDGRAGITTIGTAVASGPTLPAGDHEAAFIEDSSWASQVVDVAASGTYTLQFQASDATSASEELQLLVDGVPQTVNYNGSNSTTIATWFTFQTAAASLTLSPGLHTIKILGVGSPGGDDSYGAALVTDVSFTGAGSPTLSDGSFQALNLAAGTYQYNPANYAITATPTSGPSVSGSGGDVAGQLVTTSVRQGLQGTAIPQESWTYFDYTGGGSPLVPAASHTVYGQSNSTDPRTTAYSYTFVSASDLLKRTTVIAPPITTSQNGPAATNTDTANADVNTFEFDAFGNTQWQMDGDGFLSYFGYDPLTGGLLTDIQDVNTNDTGDFSNLPSGWTTPSGGGQELKSTYQVDLLGRPTLSTDPNGSQTYVVYTDGHSAGAGGFVNQVRVYPGWHQIGNTGTYTSTGPVQVTREYRPAPGAASGQQTVYDETLTFTAPVESTSTPSGTESIDQSDIQSLTRNQTNNAGQLIEIDAYSSLSGLTYSAASALLSGAVKADNTQSGNYSATMYAYDSRGWLSKTIDPNGTIYRTVHDYLGRVSSRWVGTADSPASGYWSPANNTTPSNMVDVEDDVYDNGGVGDSNLTQVTTHVGSGSSGTGDRVTLDLYDWRDRLIATKAGALMSGGSNDLTNETSSGVNRLLTYYNLDNLGEVLGTYTYAADGLSLGDFSNWTTATDASKLRALSTNQYDDQGRVYQSLQYSVGPGTGAIGSYLTSNTFYNHRGLTIETSNPGGPVYKQAYDGAGRDIKDSITDGGAIKGAAQNWANAGTVTSDVVIEQALHSYDPAGNLIETEQRQRFNTDPTTATGDLAGPSGGNLASRDYYMGSYFDAANRLTDSVNVGTNGGTAWSRPSMVPGGSDTVLVTHSDYNPAGWVLDTIDPRGIKSGTFYDLLGRTFETIGAWDGTQSPTPTNSTNQITDYTHDGNGDVLTMTAVQPSGGSTPNQTTGYVYGVGTTIGTDLFSKDLVGTVEYPDPSTGQPGTGFGNEEQFGYNWQGQKTSYSMRDTTTHQYLYDVLARLTADYVSSFGGNVDRTMQRLGYSFNDAGLPFQQTSYSDAAGTTIANQVQDAYNGYEQLTGEYQSHSGAVVVGTTPVVQYVYSQPAGANYSRMTAMVYPNGKQLDYNYTTTLDSAISRVDQLADHAGTYVGNDQSYLYLGLSTIVQENDGNGIALSYIQQPGQSNVLTDGGDQYTGLDRFGRVIDQNWFNNSSGVSTDRFQYGYDQSGNVLYKNNLMNSSFSELYHANSTTSGNNATAYDPLNRLTAFSRGTLSSSGHNGSSLDTIGAPSATNSWSLDALGNWTATKNGSQTRTFNSQNQITGISGQGSTVYDNGDLVQDPSGNRSFYDAWNRMVYSDTQNYSYSSYDALGRKIHEGQNGLDVYYSNSGNVIEERSGSSVYRQYVWGLGYVNNLVLQDVQGTRYYVHQDANWNVTSVTNASGSVVQRMVYDPYGSVTYLTPTWGSGSNSANLLYSFQGGRIEGAYIHFGARDYNPSLGIWMQVDPAGYVNGASLYQFVNSDPMGWVDPTGLQAQDPTDPYGGIADLANNNPAYSHGLGKDPCAGVRNWNNNMHYYRDQAAQAAAQQAQNAKDLGRAFLENATFGAYTDPNPNPAAHRVAPLLMMALTPMGDAEEGLNAAKNAAEDAMSAEKSAAEAAEAAEDGGRYSGRYADGQKAYRTNVPRDANNNPIPDPEATGPHSRLQRDARDPSRTYSATEFDANGQPVKRVDFAGRKGDVLPHQHPYDPGTKGFGPKEPLDRVE